MSLVAPIVAMVFSSLRVGVIAPQDLDEVLGENGPELAECSCCSERRKIRIPQESVRPKPDRLVVGTYINEARALLGEVLIIDQCWLSRCACSGGWVVDKQNSGEFRREDERGWSIGRTPPLQAVLQSRFLGAYSGTRLVKPWRDC